MHFGDINLNISAGSVAWYGAVLGTVGFVLSAYATLRDRAHIKVNYGWGYEVLEAGKEGIEYFKTEVVNKGRRPVKITHVGAKFHGDKKTMLFSGSFHKKNNENVLTEENPSTTYLTDQEGMRLDRIWYVYAIEARGREYRKYSSLWGFIKFWALKLMKSARKVIKK